MDPHWQAVPAKHRPFQKPPAADDWERIRQIFTELYETQNLTLTQVQEQLAHQYDFRATQRMFKTRIRLWKLDKNRKEKEMLAVVRKAAQNTSEGRTTEFTIRGKSIRLDEVHSYFRRKGVDVSELETGDAGDVPTPAAVEYSTTLCPAHGDEVVDATPMAGSGVSTDGRVVSSADHNFVDEMIAHSHHRQTIPSTVPFTADDRSIAGLLSSIEIYYSSMFNGQQWLLDTATQERHALYPSIQFGSHFLKFHDLHVLGMLNEASATLRTAFGMVRILLAPPQDARLLTYFLEAVAYTRSVGYETLANTLIRFFTAEARLVLGPWHPISVFAQALCQNDSMALEDLVALALRRMVSQFRLDCGAQHVETMRLLLTGSTILKHQKSYPEASNFLNQLLPAYEAVYGENSYQACHALVDGAFLSIEIGQYAEAEQPLLLAMHRAVAIADLREQVESRMRCLSCLATLREAEHRFDERTKNLVLALRIGKSALDEEHWMMRHARACLERDINGVV